MNDNGVNRNMQTKPLPVHKAVCLLTGFILTINAVGMLFYANMNIGIIGTLLLGAVFLLCGFFQSTVARKIPKWLKHLFVSGVALAIVFTAFLLIYGAADHVTYHEDTVIVLGSGIKGEKISVGLRGRLDSAVAYYAKNPDAVIVVSGGQGPQEVITESLAMERYLLGKGIPQEKIIKEENAANTYENFMFSKKLLDERFNRPYSVVFITSDYHVFRAESIAKTAGFADVSNYHSKTKWYSVIPSCLRECVGVLRFWILKY